MCKCCPDGQITATKALGEGYDVWDDIFLLNGEQASRATHAAHHLIGDKEDAVSIA